MTILFTNRGFAKALRAQETAQARYLSARTGAGKTAAATLMMGQALRLNLMSRFAKAAGEGRDAELRNRVLIQSGTETQTELIRHYRLAMACLSKWREAWEKNDFQVVAPALAALVDYQREQARRQGDARGLSPYDVMLDNSTPGLRYEHIRAWENDLLSFSKAAHKKHLEKFPSLDSLSSAWKMDKTGQQAVMTGILRSMGVNTKTLTVSQMPHPLCLGAHDRVTVGMTFDEEDVLPLILNTTHEGGHALYRQNLPEIRDGGLTAQVSGAGMDEAMALIMENHIARNKGFISAALQGKSIPPEDEIAARLQAPDRTFLRTRADEVRYPLDVILRCHIEHALIDAWYPVRNLHEQWNWLTLCLSGDVVKDDRSGILQDIHMFSGVFGRMPAYFAGQLAAAQIYETAIKENPAIGVAAQAGNAEPLANWLATKVYGQGAAANMPEQIKNITGQELGVASYKTHISQTYPSLKV